MAGSSAHALWGVVVCFASGHDLGFSRPPGVLGEFTHITFSGAHGFSKSQEESNWIFWRSTGEILAVHLVGLVVIWGAWKLQKRLRPERMPQL